MKTIFNGRVELNILFLHNKLKNVLRGGIACAALTVVNMRAG